MAEKPFPVTLIKPVRCFYDYARLDVIRVNNAENRRKDSFIEQNELADSHAS